MSRKRDHGTVAVAAKDDSSQIALVKTVYPPIEFVEKYETMLSGSAERFLRIVEKEQEHDHRQEADEDRREYVLRLSGLWLGAFLCLCAMGGGVFLISTGHAASGWTALVSALVVVLTAIVGGRRG